MNKYEKAYKQLHRMILNDYSMGSRIINDFNPLKELVERTTPKKYYNPPTQGYIDYECPNCHKYLCSNERKTHYKYCYRCGQALDWSD